MVTQLETSKYVNGIGNGQTMFLVEKTTFEDIVNKKPLSNVAGIFFKRLLKESGYNIDEIYVTNYVKKLNGDFKVQKNKEILKKEIEDKGIKKLVALGGNVNKLFSKKVTFSDIYDSEEFKCKIYSWYSPEHIFQRGRILTDETLLFLQIVKNQ